MKKLISIKNITKHYGEKIILRDINFDVYEHEHIALIGANGSGKSTLIEIILNTISPNSGTIEYGFKIEDVYKIFGTQFQEANYPKGLKVKDIIKFFADIYNVNDKEYLKELMTGFKLEEINEIKIGGLSGGQLQRLNIMLALIHKPKILVLDEITNGLDIQARQEIKNYIKSFVEKNNLTLIIISHSVEEIESLANRVLFLNDGIIKDNLKMSEIKQKFGSLLNYTDKIFGGHHV